MMKAPMQTAVEICSLPAVPTHDWTTRAANTLAILTPTLAVGVCIAQLDESSSAINLISAGVATQAPEHTADALFLLDKLERLTELGLTLPHQTCQRGLVAPLRTLHNNWQGTSIGRIFASQSYQCPVIAIIPIDQTSPGFVLIAILATQASHLSAAHTDPTESLTNTLGQLAPLLSEKAHIALQQVANPKAWLTDREHEILDQLILGNSVRAIADAMGRSTHTVHDHVKNLHKKLGATSRGQLIAKALGYASPTEEKHVPAPNPMILLRQAPLPELKPSPRNPVYPAQSQPQAKPQAKSQAKPQARPLR